MLSLRVKGGHLFRRNRYSFLVSSTYAMPKRANSGSTNSGSSVGSNLLKGFRAFFHRSADQSSVGEDNQSPATNGHDETKKTRYSVARKAQESETWKEEKEKYLKMPEEEKRTYCRTYVVLNEVPTWTEYYKKYKKRLTVVDEKVDKRDVDEELNSKVSIWRGDITTLEIDCIVNAANESLLGGGGVDGAIHRAAGSNLVQECRTLHGCQTGDAKITGGYKLPAKYIIHTVGPVGRGDKLLRSCYKTSLEIMTKNGLSSIAFPCISTGIYGFPADRAANIALDVARTYLEKNRDKVERIIFCLFMEHDVRLYEQLMQVYFPISKQPEISETSKNDDLAAQTDDVSTKISEKDKHSESKKKTSNQKANPQKTVDNNGKQVNSSGK